MYGSVIVTKCYCSKREKYSSTEFRAACCTLVLIHRPPVKVKLVTQLNLLMASLIANTAQLLHMALT